MERFYLQDLSTEKPELTGSELHHMKNVMRARVGDTIELFDGCGTLAQAEILSLNAKAALLQILTKEKQQPPKALVQLGISLLRLHRLEWALEKATELGAHGFYLFEADHSEKKPPSSHQLERMQTLILSACKQCKRLYLPSVEQVSSLEHLLFKPEPIFFGDLKKSAPTVSNCTLPASLIFVSGPERGFSKRELDLLENKAQGVSLSQNVLRAETAPIAAAALFIERIDNQ